VSTGHEGNIFSVKFIPNSSDTLVATCASDDQVRLTNVLTNETLLSCKNCHSDRVKRLATHVNEPYLVWSAGEDGYIMQYDIREQHNCKVSKPKNLLIDLNTAGSSLAAKCLAINPMRDEMLAVGSNDVFIRMFDRRFMGLDGWNSCTAYFTPGHLLARSPSNKSKPQSFGSTYLAFNQDGSELLANIHAEQIYLFNTYEPWERYKSYSQTLRPLIMNEPTISEQAKCHKPYSPWRELQKRDECIQLPEKYRHFYQEAAKVLGTKRALCKRDFDQINQMLSETKNCPKLYSLRASALIARSWRGDHYAAIRDCCCALALDPMDFTSMEQLALASYFLGDSDAAHGLHKLLKMVQELFSFEPNDGRLEQVVQSLSTMARMLQQDSPETWDADSGFNTDENHRQHEDYVMLDDPSSIPQVTINNLISRMFTTEGTRSNDLLNLTNAISDQCRGEIERASNAFDYTKRFCGHCNMNTDIKEVNFFGQNGEFIVGGSDDGAFYIWDKETTNIVKAVYGDMQILNCLQPHPSVCVLATSGIEPLVKLWSPSGKTCLDVTSLEMRCTQNQDFITSDPLEAMIMMLYPNRDS